MASRAGASAETSATASPVSSATLHSWSVSSTGVGRLVVYSAFTVTEINCTVPPASTRPSAIPKMAPAMPNIRASVRNSARTVPREAPMARRIPISARRRTMLTEMVL